MFQNFVFQDEFCNCGGIPGGLEIKGLGTFVLKLDDESRRSNAITILNLLNIPDHD